MIDVARETSSRAPVALANPDYYGTLAATRALGESGVPVHVLDARLLGISRWSRHAARAFACPPLEEPDRFLDWLLAHGAREPGTVLYPTSDETTFLYALRRDELSRTYRMYQPALDVVLHVLDKRRLYGTAREVGIDVPDTWFPETDADVARVSREAPMPLLVKPRTQVLSRTHSKGIIVQDAASLSRHYRAFVRATTYPRAVLDVFPEAPRAMLQRYYPEAAEQIYVLAAFLDRSGQHFAARSALKVFQCPRSLGVGLCFEDATLDPKLSDAVRRLALACGYFGLFQLEFIRLGERFLLIDFNPRFYNQLAYDIARGLLLPQMVYAAALDDAAEVARLVGQARTERNHNGLVFCNRFGLNVMLSTQRLAGRISADEASHWRSWRHDHQRTSIDPAIAPGDALPGVVDVASQLYGYFRHPRAFWRKIVLDRTAG
jgi:D-aspartate ligase